MNRILATPVIAALLLIAGTSFAETPNLPIVQAIGIQLGGRLSGATDPLVLNRVRVLHPNGQPMSGSIMDILFSACPGADLHVATTQSFPGMSWNCATKVATVVMDADGAAFFRLAGSATAFPGNSPGITDACALIRVDGVLVGSLRVGAYDLDGKNGVNASDQALFLSTLFAVQPAGYRARADYNGDGLINTADFSRFLGILLRGGSATSATPNCF